MHNVKDLTALCMTFLEPCPPPSPEKKLPWLEHLPELVYEYNATPMRLYTGYKTPYHPGPVSDWLQEH